MPQTKNYNPISPDSPATYGESAIIFLSTDCIRPNRSQPRKRFDTNTMIRLADSVRRYGILQPLTVRPISHQGASEEVILDSEPQFYELIAGERRLRAAKLAGMTRVPCILASVDDHLSAELAMIENLLREDLDMFEQARAFGRLILQFSLTQEQVARKMSMSQSAVANKLRLLRLTEEEQRAILEGGLTERHARTLLRLPANENRKNAILHIVECRMNVASAEAYIEKLLLEHETSEKSANSSQISKQDSASPLNSRNIHESPCLLPTSAPSLTESASFSLDVDSRGKKKLVLQDLRIFYNSLERAVGILKQTGLSSRIEELRHHDCLEIRIVVEHPNAEIE